MKLSRKEQLLKAFSLQGEDAPKTERKNILTKTIFEDSTMRCKICSIAKKPSDFRFKLGSEDERMEVCSSCSSIDKTKPDYVNSPHRVNRKMIVDNFLFY